MSKQHLQAVKATFAETSALSYFGNLLGWSLGTLRLVPLKLWSQKWTAGLEREDTSFMLNKPTACITAQCLPLFLPAPPKVQAAVHKVQNNAQIILSFSTMI